MKRPCKLEARTMLQTQCVEAKDARFMLTKLPAPFLNNGLTDYLVDQHV